MKGFNVKKAVFFFLLLLIGFDFQISANITEIREEIFHKQIEYFHGGCCKNPKRRHRKLSLIQLDDGSIWKVHTEDLKKMVKWKKKHLIIVKPYHHCLYPDFIVAYKYVLQNISLNEVIGVYFHSFPKNEQEDLCVEDIDYNLGVITLSDKSCWEVNVENHTYFFSWQKGDRLIIGVNNRWREEAYPQILINADRNLYHQPFLPAIYKLTQ